MTWKARRVAAWGVGAVLVASVGTGVAVAATPSPRPSVSASGNATQPDQDGRKHPRRPAFLKRLQHGEFVVRDRDGFRTVAVQRGEVTAVSPSAVTLRSADGFARTYVVTGDTKIRSRGAAGSIGDVQRGEAVTVVATKDGDRYVATRLKAGAARAAGDPGTN